MLFQINIFVLMKKIISILIIVTAISVLFAQDYLLESFTANSDGRNVVLDWKSAVKRIYPVTKLKEAAQVQILNISGQKKLMVMLLFILSKMIIFL